MTWAKVGCVTDWATPAPLDRGFKSNIVGIACRWPKHSIYKAEGWEVRLIKKYYGAPGWLSRLSGRLQLRSWSHSPWVPAPHQALCWQLRACTLLWILCLPLSLPLPRWCSVSLCLKNKFKKTLKKKKRTLVISTEYCAELQNHCADLLTLSCSQQTCSHFHEAL